MVGAWLGVIYGAGLIGILFSLYLARQVLASDNGTPEMQNIARKIYLGAMAFMRRQYSTIAMLAIVTAILLGVLLSLLPQSTKSTITINGPELGIKTSIAFLAGAICSGISGFVGMFVAIQANLRTAAAARRSLSAALQTSLRGGAVSGFLVVALSLLGLTTIFLAYGGLELMNNTPNPQIVGNVIASIVGFGFGASFVALFAQLGGGIYTKAADVGADLVGKVEAGIPEDDPRNPAVIADLVGDNVGDCAGRGADLFESTAAENLGAMILGVALFRATGQAAYILFPLVVLSFGVIASLIGVLAVRSSNRPHDPMNDLNLGYYVTAALSAVAMFGTSYWMLQNDRFNDAGWKFGLCGLIGILTSIAFVFITQYYTSGSWRPVREIAQSSRTGPATVIISGTAVGFETTAFPTLVIGAALMSSFGLGQSITGVDPHSAFEFGIFGTAVATMGMLMSAAYILAMDTFGPITDNAGGIVEMSNSPESVREITDSLDAVGNTTKALTKGYAVGSAALAAFLLFSAYVQEAGLIKNVREVGRENLPLANDVGQPTSIVNIFNPAVFVGGFIGAMLVFLFSSFAIRAVGKAAQSMIEEVRRQFRADPGIMKGTSEPDYARCVDISTRGALREMIVPGVLAIGTPILVGLILRAEAVAGMLIVGTIVGVLMANFLNNSGGAWDNAKKWIEAGNLKDETGKVLGKRSEPHAAAVVGDTVGDPFKDTAGPALHVLIKLLATITLVLVPLFV
ncbi:MAG: V-type H(+)-translocating pyrophosphatase [Chloroflexi bacterium]|jgi:K(+)-stimulated pyrophosphate-energized sodium pump|nr:V-type H(+)-translocating pyrophosphatase [Chloroflexota bacterium]